MKQIQCKAIHVLGRKEMTEPQNVTDCVETWFPNGEAAKLGTEKEREASFGNMFCGLQHLAPRHLTCKRVFDLSIPAITPSLTTGGQLFCSRCPPFKQTNSWLPSTLYYVGRSRSRIHEGSFIFAWWASGASKTHHPSAWFFLLNPQSFVVSIVPISSKEVEKQRSRGTDASTDKKNAHMHVVHLNGRLLTSSTHLISADCNNHLTDG